MTLEWQESGVEGANRFLKVSGNWFTSTQQKVMLRH